MGKGNQPRDYDAEIAVIVKIAEHHNVQAPFVVPMQADNGLSTPIIKWVARTDEDESHANA
jgi:hypothetical protein